MKNINIIILFVCFLYLNANAQFYSDCDSLPKYDNFSQDYLTGHLFTDYNRGMKEQYYGDWYTADVLLENNKKIYNVRLRYNCLLEQFLWQRETNGQIAVADKEPIKSIVLYSSNNNVLEFEKVNFSKMIGNDTSSVYLQILNKGKIVLYARRKILITMSGEVLYKDRYYILHNNNLKQIYPKVISLIVSLGDDKKMMKNVLRENRVWVRNEETLVKAINAYNRAYSR